MIFNQTTGRRSVIPYRWRSFVSGEWRTRGIGSIGTTKKSALNQLRSISYVLLQRATKRTRRRGDNLNCAIFPSTMNL